MAKFINYSIGKKFIQALSGAFLIIFLLVHVTINLFSVLDTFTGEYGKVAADHELFSKGDGLFQMGCDFMSLPIVTIMVPILALGFIIHIVYGIKLTWINIKARGGFKRYEVPNRAATDSWSAKNMFVLGMIILGVLFLHLSHFWAKMQLQEFIGHHSENPYLLLDATFQTWWMLLIYIVWFVFVWLHLIHGFWSMFQTVGWNNDIWLKRLKVLGFFFSTIICLGFIAVAINSYLHANSCFGLESAKNVLISLGQ